MTEATTAERAREASERAGQAAVGAAVVVVEVADEMLETCRTTCCCCCCSCWRRLVWQPAWRLALLPWSSVHDVVVAECDDDGGRSWSCQPG